MLKKDLENLFSSCHKVKFRKKHIVAIFRLIFQKIDIVSDVIIAIAATLKFFFYQLFCNIIKYDCAKFLVKAFFYQDLCRWVGRGGEALCAPPWCMIRQKYTGADRVKRSLST